MIAIEIDGTTQRAVEEGDSLQLIARAISASGDTVPDVEITWQLLDIDSGQVGFTIDPGTGVVTALHPGTGRVRPRVEDLVFDPPIEVTVTGAPDSVAAGGAVRLTLAAAATESPSLTVGVFDLTTEPDVENTLPDKPVTFELVEPTPGSTEADGFFLTESDPAPGPDPHRVVATTSDNGQAEIVVRRIQGMQLPDSAIIDAVVLTALDAVVPGSPITFVVIFESN